MHLFPAMVELPCALRMEEDTLTEAVQLHAELSAEETGSDEGDKEPLDEAPSPGFRCRRRMEARWTSLNEHVATFPSNEVVLFKFNLYFITML